MSQDNANNSTIPNSASPSPHTSIVYFHGIGTPKRYEELSRVIDSMDRHLTEENNGRLGVLRGQRLGVEPPRAGGDEPITFFRFSRFTLRDQGGRHRTVLASGYRLYESYWSPAAAGAIASVTIMLWLLARLFHPLAVLSKPWRAHQRLKRTHLYGMFYDRGKMPALRYRQLAAVYRDFEGMNARRQHRSGSFSQFETMIKASHKEIRASEDLLSLARGWRRGFIGRQGGVLFLGLTLLAGITGVLVLSASLAAAGLSATGVEHAVLATLTLDSAELSVWTIALFAGLLAAAVITGRRFLRSHLSDVVFWTTTLEKDVRYRKRREILKAAEDMLRHVLADPGCNRVVIVGHSLGTAIAFDTLIGLGRRLAADREHEPSGTSEFDTLNKVSHLISLGSPIDRISYFFQLTFSRYHRFNRVADELNGSTGQVPFRESNKQAIQWINIRDRSDPISSRLFSTRGPIPNREDIQEVETASSHFPGPAGAHVRYFETRLVAKLLVDIAILGRTTLQLQIPRPLWSKRWGNALRFLLWGVATTLAWAAGVAGLALMLDDAGLLGAARLVATGAAAILLLLWVGGRVLDRRYRLTLRG